MNRYTTILAISLACFWSAWSVCSACNEYPIPDIYPSDLQVLPVGYSGLSFYAAASYDPDDGEEWGMGIEGYEWWVYNPIDGWVWTDVTSDTLSDMTFDHCGDWEIYVAVYDNEGYWSYDNPDPEGITWASCTVGVEFFAALDSSHAAAISRLFCSIIANRSCVVVDEHGRAFFG